MINLFQNFSSRTPSLQESGLQRTQHTTKKAVTCKGVGVHSGQSLTMTIYPASAHHGIQFQRLDVSEKNNVVKASWDNVIETALCTKIANSEGVSVSTVEHVMAALSGAQVDNVLITIDGPELPIMDGSAAPFLLLLEEAGIKDQKVPRSFLQILKPVSITADDGRMACLTPASEFSLEFDFEWDRETGFTSQHYLLKPFAHYFKQEIARARTFGFLQDAEKLRAMGLAKGASLENAVVIDQGRILNEDGLRYQDEFVRHKVLDAVGDLYMTGVPILGHFYGKRSGHSLNNQLLREVYRDASNWQLVHVDAPSEVLFSSVPSEAISYAHA